MSNICSFSTKRGEVSFTEDTIEISGSTIGYYKSLYDEYWKSDSVELRTMFILILLSFPVSFYSVFVLLNTSYGYELILGLSVGIVMLHTIQYSRGFRNTDTIPLISIEKVEHIRGKSPFTRPRLIIHYTPEDGSTLKRRINMPSLYSPTGEEDFEKSKTAFEQRGLLFSQE